jgi:SPP1 family predicted phage head-tail adaptor
MPDPIDIGQLRNRVLLQYRPEPDPVAGPAGDEVVTWSDVGTYRAKVEALTGRELWQAVQAKSTADYKITLRNVGPIDPLKNRFVYRGTMVLYPTSVTRIDNRNEFLEILATFMRGESP